MIYFDDDTVKIGGVILPGIYKSMEVSQDAQVDEQDVEGSSRKPKQASGYDDAKITISLQLLDSMDGMTKEGKLQIIQNIFRAQGQEKPVVHELVSTHSSIRGIMNVIVKSMSSKESNKKDEITVDLELLQYDTVTITAKKGKKKTSVSEGTGTGSGSTLSKSYQSYAANSRGKAPKQENKTAKTPATDNAGK